MARKRSLGQTISRTIPHARGIADRAVTTVRPVLGSVVGRVADRFPRRRRTQPSEPETFSPSPVLPVVTPVVPSAAVEESPVPATGASPATVARNAAGPRPTAKAPAKAKPRSAPGAKLPVSRPS